MTDSTRPEVTEADLAPFVAVSEVGRGPALVLAPSAADAVFGCAGALLRHQANGDPVAILVFGGAPAQASRAVQSLDVPAPERWDCALEYSEQLIERLVDAIRASGAALVYVPSPVELHSGLRTLGLVGLEAVRRCGAGLTAVLYEVGSPLARPNCLLDLTALEARKAAAMACFDTPRQADQLTALNRYRTATLPPAVTAAEAFRRIPAAQVSAELLMLLTGDLRVGGQPVASDSQLPLVSVIVRTIGRDTLPEALASIAAQTYPRVEVVLVDATERALSFEPWCGRFPVRVVGGEHPRDRAAAANLGLDAAQGELLMFLDDDDELYPHHLHRLQGVLSTRRARVAYAAVECVTRQPDGSRSVDSVFNQPFSATRLLTENYIPIHAVLFARSLVTTQGCRFDEALELLEDWDFWLQVSRHTDFIHVPEVGARYRMPGGSPLYTEGPAARAQDAMAAKWQRMWTLKETRMILASAQEHLSPGSSTQNSLRSLREELRVKGEQLGATTQARDEAQRATAAATASRDEALHALAQANTAREHALQALDAADAARDSERHAREVAEVRGHELDGTLARLTLEWAAQERTAASQRDALAGALEHTQLELHAAEEELAALKGSAAFRTASLVGGVSPRLQRAVGQALKTVLPKK